MQSSFYIRGRPSIYEVALHLCKYDIYIYTSIYLYIYINTCIYIYIHKCMYIYIYIYIYTYVCIYVYLSLYIYIYNASFTFLPVCISILHVLNAFIILSHASLSLYLSLSLSPVDPLQITYFLYRDEGRPCIYPRYH